MDEIEVWDVDFEEIEIDGVEVSIETRKSEHNRKVKGMYVGIDPGTKNLGMAVIDSKEIYLFQIKIDRPKDSIKRMKVIRKVFARCVNWYEYNTMLVIEGSAYSRAFREAELSEVRATAVWWGLGNGFDIYMVKPNSVRKVVFGNGKTKPQDVWEGIPPDAANALACAWWGIKK